MRRDAALAVGAMASVAVLTAIYTRWLGITNTTTVALTFLMIVLLVAATSRLAVAVAVSVVAMACFNFFFLPPVGTLAVADPRNWVALGAFLAVSLVGSHLSAVARARTDEAVGRREEMSHLFHLSRDILLLTEGDDAVAPLPALIVSRFGLDYAAICLPEGQVWRIADAGPLKLSLAAETLEAAMTSAGGVMATAGTHAVRLTPLRFSTKAVGLLATCGRAEPGTLDAVGGIAAIAVERAQLLEERKAAELSRRSEELKSALLAALTHDLRTPLTTIRVAATNLQASWPTEEERREQSALILTEVGRLTRLFQNVLEMARIDTGAIGADLQWVYPSQILEAALDQVGDVFDAHVLDAVVESNRLVRVDPRLTATALAHLLENAAQYAPEGSIVAVSAVATGEGLVVQVRDRGRGIAAGDLPHIFDRFYRGAEAVRRRSGTGMGLAIARGLLAAERGQISVENCADGGARFTVVVPAETRAAAGSVSMEPVV
jgi:two-component system sensor histidine kinase KdpD